MKVTATPRVAPRVITPPTPTPRVAAKPHQVEVRTAAFQATPIAPSSGQTSTIRPRPRPSSRQSSNHFMPPSPASPTPQSPILPATPSNLPATPSNPPAMPSNPPAPQTSNSDLPAGWEAARTSDGRVYYMHRQLKVATWDKPFVQNVPLDEPVPPPPLSIPPPLSTVTWGKPLAAGVEPSVVPQRMSDAFNPFEGTTNTPNATSSQGTTNTPNATSSQGTTNTPNATSSQGTTNTPNATSSQGTTNTPNATSSQWTTNTPNATSSQWTTNTPNAPPLQRNSSQEMDLQVSSSDSRRVLDTITSLI